MLGSQARSYLLLQSDRGSVWFISRPEVLGWHFEIKEPVSHVHQPSLSLQSCCRGARRHDRARLSAGFSGRRRCGTGGDPGASRRLPAAPGAQDLRRLLWSSIDNDTSKDLDQIEWAEQLPDGRIRVLVGVADVDARVSKGTVIWTATRRARRPLSILASRCFRCCRLSSPRALLR